ncbi:hypothetical protein B0H10DRAFT_2021199 [Mycena sp. CBHHK59/15]|nr:hypothetical protein B0H10DRAFT_2021199 [Mycena sp. CBHHK59/15]
MDFIKKFTENKGQESGNTQGGHGQQGGGPMDKINGAMGGGASGEAKEDYLDKGVDFVQERMGGGDQSNESAVEQAKDEQISDAIRKQYKNATGSDIPIKDKN